MRHARSNSLPDPVSNYLKDFLEEKKAVIGGIDRAALHRMRVSSRRLREAFRVFKGQLPRKQTKKWRRCIREVGKILGKARELDIQLRFLSQVRAGFRDPASSAGFRELAELLSNRRKKVQKRLAGALNDPATEKMLSGLSAYLNKLPSPPKSSSKECVRLVSKRLARLLGYKPYVARPEMADEMHQMRIAAKRLRYTLEICRPTLGNRSKTFLASARAVQDVLGDLHELDVWLDYLPKVMEEHKSRDIRGAAERLQQRCRRLRAQTHRQFVGLWKRIEREKVWEQLRKKI